VKLRFIATLAFAVTTLCSSVLLQAQNCNPHRPNRCGMSASKLAHIKEAFAQEIDKGNLPGVVVMVARKGKLVYSETVGFQNKEAGKALSKDAIFRIYSMTKPLVSVGAMMLIEDGKMQLNDAVSKFIPAVKGLQVSVAKADGEFAKVTYTLVPSDREMTVQDLLRHTSGLAYANLTFNSPVKDAYAKGGIDDDPRGLTPAQEIESFSKSPLIHQPGTIWEYSLSTDMLGRVIEAVSGKRLADYMEERLFKPLQMNDTGFWVPLEKQGRLAEALPIDTSSGKPNKLWTLTRRRTTTRAAEAAYRLQPTTCASRK